MRAQRNGNRRSRTRFNGDGLKPRRWGVDAVPLVVWLELVNAASPDFLSRRVVEGIRAGDLALHYRNSPEDGSVGTADLLKRRSRPCLCSGSPWLASAIWCLQNLCFLFSSQTGFFRINEAQHFSDTTDRR